MENFLSIESNPNYQRAKLALDRMDNISYLLSIWGFFKKCNSPHPEIEDIKTPSAWEHDLPY